MTIKEAKSKAIRKIKAAAKQEAPIETEILLAHALGISREEMLAHDERPMPTFALRRFKALIARRVKHEPVAYLTGHKEFFGLDFSVNKHTLIPRPETELLVEEALKTIAEKRTPPTPSSSKRGADITPPFGKGRVGRVLLIDVGTGSGAIAVAVAKNALRATVIATDVSAPALKLAEQNATANDVADRIIFLRSDLITKIMRPHFLEDAIIVANLPYLPTKVWQKTAPEVKRYEPRTALDGGKDGLRYYDKLFHQIAGLLPRSARASLAACETDSRHLGAHTRRPYPRIASGGNSDLVLICEIDPSQKRSFPALVKRHFPDSAVTIKNDLAGSPRVAIITKN